jgi:hypothetical protein
MQNTICGSKPSIGSCTLREQAVGEFGESAEVLLRLAAGDRRVAFVEQVVERDLALVQGLVQQRADAAGAILRRGDEARVRGSMPHAAVTSIDRRLCVDVAG